MCCRILFGSYVSAEEEGGSKTDTDKHKEREGDREREIGKKREILEIIRTLALRGAHSSTPLRLIHNMDPVYFAYFML